MALILLAIPIKTVTQDFKPLWDGSKNAYETLTEMSEIKSINLQKHFIDFIQNPYMYSDSGWYLAKSLL